MRERQAKEQEGFRPPCSLFLSLEGVTKQRLSRPGWERGFADLCRVGVFVLCPGRRGWHGGGRMLVVRRGRSEVPGR